MANKEDRYEDNVAGPFFVDSECIACDTCTGVAPTHFKLTPDYDHAIVFSQPKKEVELETCFEALNACPVDAIGYEKTNSLD